MTELDEDTNLLLAEWEQQQAYFKGCTTITDYEKFMLCFYLSNFIYFIGLRGWKFEMFYSQIVQVLNLEKTKCPKYTKLTTEEYKQGIIFKEKLKKTFR